MTDMVALAEQTTAGGRTRLRFLRTIPTEYRTIDDVRRGLRSLLPVLCYVAVVFPRLRRFCRYLAAFLHRLAYKMSPMAARLMHIGQVLSVRDWVSRLCWCCSCAGWKAAGAKGSMKRPHCALQKIADGGSTAQALSEVVVFRADGRLLALSERTGSMAETLKQVAERCRKIPGSMATSARLNRPLLF